MSRRAAALINARLAGYHNDSRAFTRLRIETRVALEYLAKEWLIGKTMRERGVPCTCSECNAQRLATTDPAAQAINRTMLESI